jgi:uncharacterized membrane protein required for colicin V production
MSTIDLCIIVGVLIFCGVGFRDGFVKKIYSIVGLWAGLIISAKSLTTVGPYLADVLQTSKEASHILAFSIVFLLVVVLEMLFYRWFGPVGGDALNLWARMGGVVIGFVQGVAIASLFLVMLSIVDLPSDEDRKESSMYPSVFHFAPTAFDLSTGWIGDSKGFLQILHENFGSIKLPK